MDKLLKGTLDRGGIGAAIRPAGEGGPWGSEGRPRPQWLTQLDREGGAPGRSRQPLATPVSPMRPPLCGGPPLLGSPCSPPLCPLPVPSLLCPGLSRRPARLCKATSSSREPSHRLRPTAVLSPWPGPLQLDYWLALRLCEVARPSCPSPAQGSAQCHPRVAVLWVEGHRL